MEKNNVKLGYKQARIILVLLVCMVIALSIFNFSLFMSKNSADAFKSGATPASFGSLTFSDYSTRNGKPFDGDVLDKLYGAITSGQGGTSTAKDTYVNAYSKVKSSTSTVTGTLDSGYDPNWTQTNSMDFRLLSGGSEALTAGGGTAPNPITVEFGGFKWNVVYATTNTTDSHGNGDLIVTLWMSESSAETYKWSNFSSTDMSKAYPSDMYSTSRVRVETLNAGGGEDIKYATGVSARDGAVVNDGKTGNRESNQFAQFTLPSSYVKSDGNTFGKKSLTQYLEPVSNLEYQRAENYIWAYDSGTVNLNPNEAWGEPDMTVRHGGKSGWYSATQPTVVKDAYFEWIDDLLWLPSTIESGFVHNQYNCVSLWGIPRAHSILLNDNTILCRTADFPATNQLLGLLSNGNLSIHAANITASIRPALHLNLTKAEQNCSRSLAVPQTVTTTFNNTKQDMDNITTPSWYNPAKMSITYTNSNMVNAGTYKATVTLVNIEESECWADGTKEPKEFSFVIKKKDVEVEFSGSPGRVPTVDFKAGSLVRGDTNPPKITLMFKKKGTISESTTPPTALGTYIARATIPDECNYNIIGDKEYEFTLELNRVKVPQISTPSGTFTGSPHTYFLTDYDPAFVNIKASSDVILDKDEKTLTITDAGTYEIKAELIDDINNNWDSEIADDYLPKTIGTIVIDPAIANVSITDENGETEIESEISDRPQMEITVDTLKKEKVKVNIYATPTGGSGKFLVASAIVVDGTATFSLNLTGLNVGNKYNLFAELTNADDEKNRNYTLIPMTDPTIEVKATSKAAQMLWRLTHGRKKYSFNAGETVSATYTGTIVYDEQVCIWEVDANRLALNNYAVDTSYGNNGYLNSSKTDAGTYTTSVRIKSTVVGGVDPGIFEITWTIDKATFDLSKVKWKSDGVLEYNGQLQEMALENLPSKLVATYGGTDSYRDVTSSSLHVEVLSLDFVNSNDANNYFCPDVNDSSTYIGNVVWETDWSIIPKKINIQWGKELIVDENENSFNLVILRNKSDYSVVTHTYYKSDGKGNKVGEPISESSIKVPSSGVDYYICELTLSDANGYELIGNTTREFEVALQGEAVTFTPNSLSFSYSGNTRSPQFANSLKLSADQYQLVYYSADGNKLPSAPTNIGTYRVEIQLNSDIADKYFIGGNSDWEYEIVQRVIDDSWNLNSKPPRMNINKADLNMIEYEFSDEEGNIISWSDLKAHAGNYKVRAKIKTENIGSCTFSDGITTTDWVDFELTEQDLAQMQDPNDSSLYPDEPTELPNNPDDGVNKPDDTKNDNGDFDKFTKFIKQWWQVAASAISIALIIIFLAKTAGYESRRREANKTVKEKYTSYYAAATGLFGLAMNAWTAIACVLMGLALVSLVVMIISKNKCKKAEKGLADSKEEYERNRAESEAKRRDENMQMMFMHMMGGNAGNGAQGAYMGAQGIGVEEMRGLISETVTALLPGMQQMLPQQASANDEIMKKLIEDNAKNQEALQKIMQTLAEQPKKNDSKNDEVIKSLLEGQKAIMQKLSEQPAERVVEREVAASNANDETIKQMLGNQEKLMEKILELSANQKIETQIVEKPVEKIVEVPVEKVVEKVVEKEVKVAAAVVAKPKREVAPRLTLEEAYAKLSKQQKKFFDDLREYAMSKDSKCKEKLSTYFTTIGPTTTNPYIKLTIKKNTTVAMFKLEDEYTKDIRRNAGADGTKVKIKETEVTIGDKQAFETAKDMVDLRIDQIDRYNDYLKEQRSMKRK